MIQDTVLLVTLLLMGLLLAVFSYVAFHASADGGEYEAIQKKSYGMRSKFFIVLLVAGVIITVVTTQDLPFAASRGDLSGVSRNISVSGHQWYWQLSEQSAQQGETVVFNVSAGDVNHGLGIYDPDMVMIGQTQAMPGYENALKIHFEKPGTYKLMCMEYCGLAHHVMISDFTVTKR